MKKHFRVQNSICVCKRVIALLLAIVAIAAIVPHSILADDNNAKICVTSANIRNQPGTSGTQVIATLPLNMRVCAMEVVNLSADPSGHLSWCKISFSWNGQAMTGYIVNEFLQKDAPASSDPDFEVAISGFPESYKPYLRTLHASHPSWTFTPVNVDFDYNTLVDLESIVGVSLISNSVNDSWKSTEPGAYNWYTDEFVVYDGSSWVNANKEVVRYYVDPRNYLNENACFAFLNLAYDASTQNADSVTAILRGSFMEGKTIININDQSVSYVDAFMDAANASHANPLFLATKVLQEVSASGSGSTSGTYSALPGYYNFYNIGAYSSSDPIAKALQFAKNGTSDAARNQTLLFPWFTPYRAVVGGGIYIADQYINKGQNTIYSMKFNVYPNDSTQFAKHQYMTNIQGVTSEATCMRKAYANAGILDTALSFSIPVYQNMAETTSLPTMTGSPNQVLASITVEGYNLTPSFDFLNVKDYSLVVPSDVTSVRISATTVNRNATVSGVGDIVLHDGMNDIPLVVTAQNGATNIYTIHIAKEAVAVNPYISSSLAIQGVGISGVGPGSTAAQVISVISVADGYSLQYLCADGTVKDGAAISVTGDLVQVINASGEVVYTGIIVVRGDLNGDGKISSSDLTMIARYITLQGSLSQAALLSGDVNKDGKISSADLTYMARHITKQTTIQP